MDIEQQIQHDLKLSGLTPKDIHTRKVDMTERASCGLAPSTEGYVIPYYNLIGKPLPFFRIRLFGSDIKYKQIKNTPNHVYFPPSFLAQVNATGKKYIIVTEGEKKAACATKLGFPAIAFGGVDSWRNKILLLPRDTEFSVASYNKKLVGAKLPSSTWSMPEVSLEPIALGFADLTHMILQNDLQIIIIYDTDEATTLTGMKPEVQRAASELGFEFRRRGVPLRNIRQLILPLIEGLDKTGLDDFLTLLDDGTEQLDKLIAATIKRRTAFPQHPNMQENLDKKLQATKLSRREVQKLSLSVITDLDSRGVRMFSKDEQQLYYFDDQQKRLVKVDLSSSSDRAIQNTSFSKLLYRRYGLSIASDVRITKWLATQFAAEEPVENVRPFRSIARLKASDDCVRYQINDGQYVKITGDPAKPLEIMLNGTENVLFESEQVVPIDADDLLKEFKKRTEEPLSMWWEDVLHDVRLKDHGKIAVILSLLYYISPWLLRWRGTQLPVELVIGEAGSGKSTLCELRLSILTGAANLRNAPADFKDWHASIANTGGLHVTDNVQLLDKSLKQRLSDEICRLITEPEPHIEMRKYYTNVDLMSARVDAVFVFTAITQPFQQSDFLQRSIKVELDKLAVNSSLTAGTITYDSSWKAKQLDRFGGRTAWLSHHLYVLHKFFERIPDDWDTSYKAKHRLINLEQIMCIMADIFGLDNSWIPAFLASQTDDSIVEADWMLEGLSTFCDLVRKNNDRFSTMIGADKRLSKDWRYTAKEIATWAETNDDFQECVNLTNSRRLGRYLQTHKAMVAQTAGLLEDGKHCNRAVYKVRKK